MHRSPDITQSKCFVMPPENPSSLAVVAPDDARTWWIFGAIYRSDDTRLFVYGAAAPCSQEPNLGRKRVVSLVHGDLEIVEQTVDGETAARFESQLEQGTIALAHLFESDPPSLPVAASRRVIQSALGQAAVRARLYYTLPELDSLSHEGGVLFDILGTLEQEIGLPFTSSYAPRIGNFEVFEMHDWLDMPPPVSCELVSPRNFDDGPQTWEISRTPNLAETACVAHFVGWSDGDLIVDRIVFLEERAQRVVIACTEQIDRYEFRLFDGTGATLLHREDHTLIRQIGLNMTPILHQTKIDDRLERRARAARGKRVPDRIVQAKTSQRSVVGAPRPGSWREYLQSIAALVSRHSSAASADRWFARGIDGELGVLDRLNALMSSGTVHTAVLVDPWFGVDALERLVLRLDSLDLRLTILTSWASIDPDTGRVFESGERPVARLEAALERLRPMINPVVTVINLTDCYDQAFHDRYLLTYPHEGNPQVFLLSNSLNSAAGKWPFVMSQIAPDVVPVVQGYIEGLLDHHDRPRARKLTCDFEWSSRAK